MASIANIYKRGVHTPGFYGSKKNLQKASKQPMKKVEAYLETQHSYTLTKQVRKKFPTRRIYVPSFDLQWSCDLAQIRGSQTKRGFQNVKYILACLDNFSKMPYLQ